MKTFLVLLIGVMLIVAGSLMVQALNNALTSPSVNLIELAEPVKVTAGEEAILTPEPPTSEETENSEEEKSMNDKEINRNPGSRLNLMTANFLFNYDGDGPAWYVVNDDVMGGVSSSMVSIDQEKQQLTFSGNLSLENNGGFASIRSQWTDYDLRAYDGIALRVRGDGNLYRFRIRTEETGAGIAYTALFETEAGTWQEIYIPFSRMVPTYRGFVVDRAGPLNPAAIRSFGLMLSDKQQGEFSLEVDWISAIPSGRNENVAVDYGPLGN